MLDGASHELVAITRDLAFDGPKYFVPDSPAPSPLDIMCVGQFANDLAIGMENAPRDSAYESRSKESNLLVLVQRLERDPDSPTVLRPSRPISTLSRDVTFRNALPMEIGCQYGARYWTEDEQQQKEGAALVS